jgi:predicted TIM-barrel fold metal-dependent hydrolase
LFGFPCDPALREIIRDPRFVAGARVLAALDLSLDVWCLPGQLDQVAELADAVPDLTIVLDHLGTPEADRELWRQMLPELARRPNIAIKLGGLGMELDGAIGTKERGATSEVLAREWAPAIETAIAAFTPARAMFESNFPPDRAAGSYGAVWNAFTRIVADYGEGEKSSLFGDVAAKIYRIAR